MDFVCKVILAESRSVLAFYPKIKANLSSPQIAQINTEKYKSVKICVICGEKISWILFGKLFWLSRDQY